MIGDAIDRTLEIIELSNRGLARLINVDVHTLTDNRGKDWEELTPKTLRKIGSICSLVIMEYSLFKSSDIIEVLNQYVFKDADGTRYSVLTAMESDKFDIEGIIGIGKLAEQSYKEKLLKTAPNVPKSSDAIPA